MVTLPGQLHANHSLYARSCKLSQLDDNFVHLIYNSSALVG